MSIGKKIGGDARGAYRWVSIVEAYRDLLPAYPDATVLEPYKHPAPPLLDRALPPHKKAVALSVVYTKTISHFVSRMIRAWAHPLKEDRDYIKLREAVGLMEQFVIPPQAWVKFSLEVFLRYGKGRYPMPAWVYSRKRLEERQEWFSWEASFNNAQGVVWVSPEHRKLLEYWEKMKQELLAKAAAATLTRSAVEESVERWVPPDKYRQWVRRARADYAARHERTQEQLAAWEWIW